MLGRKLGSKTSSRLRFDAGFASSTSSGFRPTQRCCGEFCHAQIRYPATLQDIDSSDDPWMVKARELCKTQAKGADGSPLKGNLLTPEELIGCMPQAGRGEAALCPASSCGMPASINMTMILEARGHPGLCSWLEEAGWMFNQKDPELMAQATKQIQMDEARGTSVEMGTSIAGLRYRLRVVPVCSTCFCVYKLVHDIVTATRQRSRWAVCSGDANRTGRRSSVARSSSLGP